MLPNTPSVSNFIPNVPFKKSCKFTTSFLLLITGAFTSITGLLGLLIEVSVRLLLLDKVTVGLVIIVSDTLLVTKAVLSTTGIGLTGLVVTGSSLFNRYVVPSKTYSSPNVVFLSLLTSISFFVANIGFLLVSIPTSIYLPSNLTTFLGNTGCASVMPPNVNLFNLF